MNWQRSDMQQAIAELAGTILSTSSEPWADLKQAGLLDLTDLLDITSLLIEVGRAGARQPVLPTLVLGAPLCALSAPPPVGAVLTGGLIEAQGRDAAHPHTQARNGLLYGQKMCVPAADVAEWMVTPTRYGLYAVRLADCHVELQRGTDDDSLGRVTLEGTPAERLGGKALTASWLATVDIGVSALLLGLAQRALEMTAAYVCERKQFDRQIGSFQAVQHRAADAWIDTQIMEVTLWQAAWRVSQGLPSDRERAIARYWAAEGAHRVTAAAQHLHGGFGYDRDYALHRYFLSTKQWEFLLGGANSQLEMLGALLA